MGDPLQVHRMVIGGKEREFKWDFEALRICQKKFGGKRPLDVLRDLDVDPVCEFASAGLYGAGDRSVSAERVGKWLDKNPRLFPELAKLVAKGVTQAYARTMAPEDEEAMGEEMAALDAAVPSTPMTMMTVTGGPTSDG